MSGVAAPDVAVEVIADSLAEHYGLDVHDPRWLAGEYDRNLRFTDADGRMWVAKLSDASASLAVAWQEELLVHVETAPLEFVVPRLLPTRRGDRHVRVEVAGGAVLLRVLSWVAGELLSEAPAPSESLLRSIGRTSASLTNALDGLRPSVSPPRHHWLVEDSLAAFDSVAMHGSGDAFAGRLGAMREAFSAIAPMLAEFPRGVVHQDLHDQNVLVALEGAEGERVAGVIDFNDAFDTVLVADLAVAGAYAMLRQPDPVRALAEVVRGHLEVRSLSAGELQVLLPMAAMRLAINWLTWAQRGALDGAEYAEGRSRFTRPTLEALLDEGLDAGTARLIALVAE